jgi:hypothetical protein
MLMYHNELGHLLVVFQSSFVLCNVADEHQPSHEDAPYDCGSFIGGVGFLGLGYIISVPQTQHM